MNYPFPSCLRRTQGIEHILELLVAAGIARQVVSIDDLIDFSKACLSVHEIVYPVLYKRLIQDGAITNERNSTLDMILATSSKFDVATPRPPEVTTRMLKTKGPRKTWNTLEDDPHPWGGGAKLATLSLNRHAMDRRDVTRVDQYAVDAMQALIYNTCYAYIRAPTLLAVAVGHDVGHPAVRVA